MELGLTSADSCHEVSVHPTLCDELLEIKSRLLRSELDLHASGVAGKGGLVYFYRAYRR